MRSDAAPTPEAGLGTDADVEAAPITVRCVGEGVPTDALSADGGFDVETASTLDAALESLGDVDCVVGGDAGESSASDLAAAVRERDPSLPVVLVADEGSRAVEAARSERWTDAVHADLAPSLLPGRVSDVVTRHRLRALTRRALAALEGVSEGVAVVGPDDDVAFVNAAFARQFDYAPGALVGRDWRTLYTDESVERIESDAFPSATEGWRWLGSCVGRRRGGETITVRTDVDVLDDGSKVLRATDSRLREE